jgi:hypothetical protein
VKWSVGKLAEHAIAIRRDQDGLNTLFILPTPEFFAGDGVIASDAIGVVRTDDESSAIRTDRQSLPPRVEDRVELRELAASNRVPDRHPSLPRAHGDPRAVS